MIAQDESQPRKKGRVISLLIRSRSTSPRHSYSASYLNGNLISINSCRSYYAQLHKSKRTGIIKSSLQACRLTMHLAKR
jgi:hypothetical protein